MSEAATSPQDGRLRQESREPALPLDWISAVTQVGKGGRIFKRPDLCTTRASHSVVYFLDLVSSSS